MRRQELPALTALRFPAAFAIVIFHFLAAGAIVPEWTIHNLSLGVSFFYVLSGFILCYNYPALKGKTGFWLARIARIWPVHLATLILTFILLPFVSILGHAHWPITLPLNLFLLQSWVPWKGSMLSYNGVSWSLSVEAFFYFMFPWLLILSARWGGKLLLAATFLQALVIVAIGQLVFNWPEGYGSFFPPCRLFEFVLGIYTCQVWQARDPDSPISPLHEILSLVVGIGFVMGAGPFIWHATHSLPLAPWFLTEASGLCFAWIIWTFAHHAGFITRFLSGGWAVQLGQVSFSLYMVHQLVERFFETNGFTAGMPVPVFFLLYITISMAGAYALFYGVETPARHWIVGLYRKKSASPRPDETKPR